MVVLRQLETRNFKHLDIDLHFPDGILAISGPNESGKSSIFEAILFALYGRTHKAPTGQKDRLINYDANELLVKLTFDIDNTTYSVTRVIHRKRPSQARLHKIVSAGQRDLIATGVKNVDKEIDQLLTGIGLSDLLASNVVLQKDLDRLAQLPKMQRRDVINAMMGRECFSKVVDKLAEDLRPLRKSQDPQHKALEELRRRKDDYHTNKQELTSKEKDLKNLEKELKKISQTYAQSEKRYKILKAYKTAIDNQEDLQEKVDHRIELKKRLTEELKRLNKLKAQQKKILAQKKRFDFLQKDIEQFNDIQVSATKLKTQINEKIVADDTASKLQMQIKEIEVLEDAVHEYEEIQAKRHAAEIYQRRIFSPLLYIPSIGLLAGGAAVVFFNLVIGVILVLASIPFLGYLVKTYFNYHQLEPQLTELRSKELELSEQVAKYRSKTFLEEQLTEQIQHRQELDERLLQTGKTIHAQLIHLSSDLFDKKSLSGEVDVVALQTIVESVEKKLRDYQAKHETLDEQLRSIQDQLSDIKQLKQELSRSEEELTYLEEQLASITLPHLPSEVGEYSDSLYEELDQQIRTLSEEKARLQENHKNTTQRMEELSKFLEENKDAIKEYEHKEREVRKLDETIKTGQLTIELVREVAERGREQVRPRVVTVMGRLLAAITDGKYRFPKLSEDYSLKVYSATAGEYVQADLYSGGTEDQFLLALRLGFAIALLPHGRGTAPQFLLLDEPFAGSDIQRRDNIIRLLQEELSKTFHQIIVVSHQRAVFLASEHQVRMINGKIIHSG